MKTILTILLSLAVCLTSNAQLLKSGTIYLIRTGGTTTLTSGSGGTLNVNGAPVGGGNNYVAGTGLSLSGTTFSTDSATLTVNLANDGPNNGANANGLINVNAERLSGLSYYELIAGTFGRPAVGEEEQGVWKPGSDDKVASQSGSNGFSNAGLFGVGTGITGLSPANFTSGTSGTFGSATESLTLTASNGIITTLAAQTVTPAESSITFTDITTNNAGTTAHGFLPKLPNDASLFLNGTGAFTTAIRGATSSVPGITWTLTSGTLVATGTATPASVDTTITLLRAPKVQETVASNNGLALTGSMAFTSGTMIGLATAFLTELRPGDQVGDNAAGDYGNGNQVGPQYVKVVLSNTTALVTRAASVAPYAVEKVYRAPLGATLASGTNLICVTTNGLICIGAIPTNFGFNGNNQIYINGATVVNGSFTLAGDALLSSGGWQAFTLFNASPNVILGGTNSTNGATAGNVTIGGNLTVGQVSGNLAVTGTTTFGGGSGISKYQVASASVDFGALTLGSMSEVNIACTGAAINDKVVIGPPAAPPAGFNWSGYVIATGTITLRATAITTVASGAATWTVGYIH